MYAVRPTDVYFILGLGIWGVAIDLFYHFILHSSHFFLDPSLVRHSVPDSPAKLP
jgi:hypothetical protein